MKGLPDYKVKVISHIETNAGGQLFKIFFWSGPSCRTNVFRRYGQRKACANGTAGAVPVIGPVGGGPVCGQPGGCKIVPGVRRKSAPNPGGCRIFVASAVGRGFGVWCRVRAWGPERCGRASGRPVAGKRPRQPLDSVGRPAGAGAVPPARESMAKSIVMIKIMIWGVLLYFIYRYFQLKQAVREGQRRESLQHRMQDTRSTGVSSDENGEYIDYEEVK